MTTKKLFIIRHAKAEDHSFAAIDYDRNLIDKGMERAKRIATSLYDTLPIDAKTVFISSSANRAIQTAELFAKILNFPPESILQTKKIYEAPYENILKEINKVPDNIDTIFLFGHNPGLSDLTNYLCNSYINLNTSAVAEIRVEEGLNFSELSGNTANLIQILSE